jgi:orotate phosphoribosyltransferase
MKLNNIALDRLEFDQNIVRAVTPLILESREAAGLALDIFRLYQDKINPAAQGLLARSREANAETYPIVGSYARATLFHIIHDVDETRIGLETQSPVEAEKVYRLLREQRIIKPNMEYVKNSVRGGLEEIVAALLWQVGAIKVSLGDIRPVFKVDERKNRSPIYIDVKCLPNYPLCNDFVIATAAMLVSSLKFDAVCGIEAGSIAFATLLSEKFSKPMFFARREQRYAEAPLLEGVKDHEIFRKRVLLVDDTMVRGWTKARIINEIRTRGGIIESCLVLFDRQQGGQEALEKDGVQIHSVTNRDAALAKTIPDEITLLTVEEYSEVLEYFKDPKAWHVKRGFDYFELSPKGTIG